MRISMNAEDESYYVFDAAMRLGQTVIVKLDGVDISKDVITADEAPQRDDTNSETRGFIIMKRRGGGTQQVRGVVEIEFWSYLPGYS